MTVTPRRFQPLEDYKELLQHLSHLQANLVPERGEVIVSISQEMKAVDPLSVLQYFGRDDQVHFYLEKPEKKETIVALGSVAYQSFDQPDRFRASQQFIETHLKQITSLGSTHLPFSGPHFCCSFTFFDPQTQSSEPFSSATIFLPRWQVAIKSETCVFVTNFRLQNNSNIQELTEQIWQTFQKVKLASYSFHQPMIDVRSQLIQKYVSSDAYFKSAVTAILKDIEKQRVNKVVLAHALDILSPIPFQVIPCLNHLRVRHPDCYIFSLGNGRGQTFLGATPERLVQISHQNFTTDALAGSAPRGRTPEEDQDLAQMLLNNPKERHEHRVVIDFITKGLSKIGLLPQILPSPKLLQLSNIQHLWTPIYGKVPSGVHPLELVAELHPTPAVAGVPREISQSIICQYEQFNRSLYAAPLGWIDSVGNSEFYVGIRSALLEGCQARLYAGAGIVAGSEPEKELAEIRLKLQTLLKALV